MPENPVDKQTLVNQESANQKTERQMARIQDELACAKRCLEKEVKKRIKLEETLNAIEVRYKQKEDALLKSEAYYRTLSELVSEYLFKIRSDENGTLFFEMISENFQKATGYKLQDIQKEQDWHRLFHSKDYDALKQAISRIRSGELVNFEIMCIVGEKSMWLNVYGRLEENLNTEHNESIMLAAQDITAQKRIEIEKEELECQLRQAQKMEAIGTLAGGIAHDFNNILFPMIGFLEMMIDDLKGTSHEDSLNEVLDSAVRAGELVKQILQFSRQAEEELAPLKLQPILKESLKLIRSSLPATIEIKYDIDEACGYILADPTHIHQIIMNLVTNAFHAMQDTGGILRVTLRESELKSTDIKDPSVTPGLFVVLKISDTGAGMEKIVLDRIFDPYFTTKDKGKGTGLGLSVVHGIVKSYRGEIEVVSHPSQGSEFSIYLPVMDAQTDNKSYQDQLPVEKGHERILLIDDEMQIIKMVSKMVQRLGYEVIGHNSSTKALDYFRKNADQFDLVITDMTMPNMTGLELFYEFKRIRPEIKVIIATGFSEKLSRDSAESLGLDGYVMKPIVKEELARTIRNVLDQ